MLFSRRPGQRFNRGRIPTAVGASVQTPQAIMGANCTARWKSTNGIILATGVASWLDLVASIDFAQGTGANQPAFTASGGPNNKPFLTLDGTNDSLAATLARAAPGTTPAAMWTVVRQLAWFANDPLLNDTNGSFVVRQVGASPQLVLFGGGANQATNGGLILNTWGRLQAEFVNSSSDRLQCIGTSQNAAATSGNTAGTAPLLGRNGASSVFGNFDVCEVCFFDVVPSAGQNAALDAYCNSEYGTGLI